MAKGKTSAKRAIRNYVHSDKERLNNPPVGLVTPDTDKDAGKKSYAYDPHLDPQLVWAGKAERTSFEVPTVSLHVHERIDPCTIIEAVRKRNGNGGDPQLSLFAAPEENPPIGYAKDKEKVKVRKLYEPQPLVPGEGNARWVLLSDGTYRGVTAAERRGEATLPEGGRLYLPDNFQSQGPHQTRSRSSTKARTIYQARIPTGKPITLRA